VAGDSRAGLHPSDFPDGLPVVALTCIDPRLNHLLPEVLGVREEDFIWLRNAGNIIFEPMSSMMRTLALACAVKGGKEIAVIGHTDCRVRQVSVSQLLDMFRALGIDRHRLPDNLIEFFGLFASERQNVINGVNHIRQSPLISPKVPVHGLILDVESGRLEWLVNGYEQLGRSAPATSALVEKLENLKEEIGTLASFKLSDIKLPEVKIGELGTEAQKWREEVQVIGQDLKEALHNTISPESPAPPPRIPIPPPIQGKKKTHSNST
jgi:carbonic anhydrase